MRACSHSRISCSRLSQDSTVSVCSPSASGAHRFQARKHLPSAPATAHRTTPPVARRPPALAQTAPALRGPPQPVLGLAQARVRRGKLPLQRPQDVGGLPPARGARSSRRSISASDAAASRVRGILERRQLGELRPAASGRHRAAVRICVCAPSAARAAPPDSCWSRSKRLDLLLVGPAEHVARTVVDAVAVVFFVPLSPPLICPARVTACVSRRNSPASRNRRSRSGGQLRLQPGVEARLGLDLDLAHQRRRMQCGWSAALACRTRK